MSVEWATVRVSLLVSPELLDEWSKGNIFREYGDGSVWEYFLHYEYDPLDKDHIIGGWVETKKTDKVLVDKDEWNGASFEASCWRHRDYDD